MRLILSRHACASALLLSETRSGEEEEGGRWWAMDDDDKEEEEEEEEEADGGKGGLDCDDTNASLALSALYYKCICMTTKYTYKHHNRTLVYNVHSSVR